MQIVIQVVILIVGFVLLIKGADWFVEGAAGIAEKFGIPHIVIGLTIVAIGTSLPEASVSIASALKGSGAITIGNVLGSNILNVLLILGITSLICKIPVDKMTMKVEMPFLIGVTALLAVLGLQDNVISLVEGAILLGLMALYLAYLGWRSRFEEEIHELVDEEVGRPEVEVEEEADNKKPLTLPKMILFILLGIVMITVGSDKTVDAATAIATILGVDERIIGLTIVAFGTSLPELVTSITAATKGNTAIAIGNIVGSNIFNILFVVGITAVITPVEYNASFLIDSIIAIVTVLLLMACVLPKKNLNRITGAIMLAVFVVYYAILII